MKRSNLLKQAETFVESNFYGVELAKAKSIEEVVDGLLFFFEEAGMLPPFVGVGEKDDWGYLDYDYKWEDEDEV